MAAEARLAEVPSTSYARHGTPSHQTGWARRSRGCYPPGRRRRHSVTVCSSVADDFGERFRKWVQGRQSHQQPGQPPISGSIDMPGSSNGGSNGSSGMANGGATGNGPIDPTRQRNVWTDWSGAPDGRLYSGPLGVSRWEGAACTVVRRQQSWWRPDVCAERARQAVACCSHIAVCPGCTSPAPVPALCLAATCCRALPGTQCAHFRCRSCCIRPSAPAHALLLPALAFCHSAGRDEDWDEWRSQVVVDLEDEDEVAELREAVLERRRQRRGKRTNVGAGVGR